MTQTTTSSPPSLALTDPMERMVAEAFEAAGIGYRTNATCGLDFAIDGEPVFIEVKQFHTPRIAEQMARVDNVVAIQGRQAMLWFASLVRRLAPTAPVEASGSERTSDMMDGDASNEEMGRACRKWNVGTPERLSEALLERAELKAALRPQPSGETREAVAEAQRELDRAEAQDHRTVSVRVGTMRAALKSTAAKEGEKS